MNTILIVGLIMAGCVPGALITLRTIFGKSIVFRIGSSSVLILFLFGFLMFFAGMKGIKHLYWSVPLIAILYVGSLLVIKGTISKMLKDTVASMKAITEGNLAVDIHELKSGDELSIINNSLLQLSAVLNRIIEDISANSGHLVAASQQVSSASEQLSQGANEQASSIEELSSTIEQISANIRQNTENAKLTENVSVEAKNSFLALHEKATGANEANRNIAAKITIINDISFQTNLLALNAAVEAARAGEHGKGFAVVASEVRKLAEHSKVAAEQIITMSQSALKMGQTAGELMIDTIPKIDNTVKLVQEISAASMEQNSGINQVNTAIQQLNSVTQQNASSSEALATNAEELAGQAEQLKESISFFKTRGNKNLVTDALKNQSRRKNTLSQRSDPALNTKQAIRKVEKRDDRDDQFEAF